MKKNEFSELASSLLMMGSVSLAVMPFLLGDRLILIVTDLMQEGGLMINQFGDYLTWLIS
jgi:fucose permease